MTKTILGMLASYILFSKRPKRDFENLGEELKRASTTVLRKGLSLTFAAFACTLLCVAGIVMLFYDMGFHYNVYQNFGITSIGGFSIALIVLSLIIVAIVFKKESFRRTPQRVQHVSEPLSLSERIADMIYDNWRRRGRKIEPTSS